MPSSGGSLILEKQFYNFSVHHNLSDGSLKYRLLDMRTHISDYVGPGTRLRESVFRWLVMKVSLWLSSHQIKGVQWGWAGREAQVGGGICTLIADSPAMGFHGGSAGKEFACNEGDLCSIPGWGRCTGEGNSYPIQYSGLKNSMDYTVHGVSKSWTQLCDFHIL